MHLFIFPASLHAVILFICVVIISEYGRYFILFPVLAADSLLFFFFSLLFCGAAESIFLSWRAFMVIWVWSGNERGWVKLYNAANGCCNFFPFFLICGAFTSVFHTSLCALMVNCIWSDNARVWVLPHYTANFFFHILTFPCISL